MKKSETQQIKKNLRKYNKMIELFIQQAQAILPEDSIIVNNNQEIKIKDLGNYYIATTQNIFDYKYNVFQGNFSCLFDQEGNLTFSTDFNESIIILDKNNVVIEKELPVYAKRHATGIHMQLSNGKWQQKQVFEKYLEIHRISEQLLKIDTAYHNKKHILDIYNSKKAQIMVSKINDISTEYKEFKNFEPGKFYLIIKIMTVGDNTATLNFLIDLEGNLASDAFDLERSKIYHVDVGQNQNESLQKIYNEVLLNLKKENEANDIQEQRKTSTYQLVQKKQFHS